MCATLRPDSGAPLAARHRLSKLTLAVFGASLVAAVIPMLLAWRVTRPNHALLAQAAAIGAAVLLVDSGVRIALAQNDTRTFASWAVRVNAREHVFLYISKFGTNKLPQIYAQQQVAVGSSESVSGLITWPVCRTSWSSHWPTIRSPMPVWRDFGA